MARIAFILLTHKDPKGYQPHESLALHYLEARQDCKLYEVKGRDKEKEI